MRLSRVRDYKRHLASKASDWHFRLERFVYENIPNLGSGELFLTSPIVLLAGPNGVGKTTLLRAIWGAASTSGVDAHGPTGMKLASGSASLELRVGKELSVSSVSFACGVSSGGTDLGLSVFHVDPSEVARKIQDGFCAFSNKEDIINGVGSVDLSGHDLIELNYVSRRDYSSIKLYEVEYDSGEAPFFEVSYGNDLYDSRALGSGEASILYLWWFLSRVPENSLVLIEEPETYLSAASQGAICDLIISKTVEKKLNIVITSHSPVIIGSIPEDRHIYLYRNGGSIKSVDGPPPAAILATMGISYNVDSIIYVEDKNSSALLRLIIGKYVPQLLRRIEIDIRDGDGGIISALRQSAGRLKYIRIVGAFDGDIRDKVPDDLRKYSIFLPGSLPIEQEFKNIIKSSPDSLAEAIGNKDIGMILFSLEGSDHHDWYHGLCSQIGMSLDELFPIVFRIWIKNSENERFASDFADELCTLV